MINMLDDLLSVSEVAPSNSVSLYKVALCIAVCLPVLSEAAPALEGQDISKCIGVNCAKTRDNRGRMLSFFQESDADRHGDVVELLPPVSPKSETVPKEDTKAKSNDSDNYALLHWLFPAITFFIGFLIGYEPKARDKTKTPNVELRGARKARPSDRGERA